MWENKFLKYRLKEIFNKSWFGNFIIMAVVMLIALVFRLHNLGKYSFWYDEAIVVLDRWGLQNLHGLDKLFNPDFLIRNHDYLKFLYSREIIYYWQMFFGESEFALRFSSVVFSILSIYLLYLLAKEIFNIKVARLASFLLAISPLHIYFAQELRVYALVSCSTLAALYSFLKIIKTSKNKYWWGYTIANILNIYFLSTTWTVLLAFMVFFMINIRKYYKSLRRFIIAHSLILLLSLPIILTIYPNLLFFLNHHFYPGYSEFPLGGGEKINLMRLVFTFKNFAVGYNLDYYSIVAKLATWFCFWLFLSALLKTYKRIEVKLLLVCLLMPIFLLLLISNIKPCYVDRYFFCVFPIYILFVSVAILSLRKWFSFFVMVFVIVVNLSGFIAYRDNYLPQSYQNQHVGEVERQNIKTMAKFISDNYQDKDLVFHICRNTVFPLKLYARKIPIDPGLLKQIDEGSVVFLSESISDKKLLVFNYDKLHPVSFLSEQCKTADVLDKSPRIWLVFSNWSFKGVNSWGYSAVEEILKHFNILKIEKFDGAFVYLLANKNI